MEIRKQELENQELNEKELEEVSGGDYKYVVCKTCCFPFFYKTNDPNGYVEAHALLMAHIDSAHH